MTELPKGVVLHQHPILIEFDGRTISGTYTIWRGVITVASEGRAIRRRLFGSLPAHARIMLRELEHDRNRQH
jgi:hypothetical protein